MVQQEHIARKIKEKYRHIDFVFGPHALCKLPEIIEKAMSERVFDLGEARLELAENLPHKRNKPPLASVPIMYGCENCCSGCIVPYVRGREKSREPGAIVDEIKELADQCYKEVLLLGQNVNSYGKNLKNPVTFAELLRKACEVDGIERIRFISSHPKDISDELIDVLAGEKKICKQLHLPVQSGSNEVLRMMNRRYTREKYLEIIDKVRSKIPDIALTTDIIVGFPTETNEDFEDTLDLVRRARYDTIFSFIYSRRNGTPAAKMPFALTDDEIHKNFDRLLEVQNEISKEKNEACVGKTFEILVEGPSKTDKSMMFGRTDGGKIVNFAGSEDLVSQFVNVKIIDAHTWSLTGEIRM
jgi:tRNA-2-methylthio-N6-dimethylallyladenosine synthase